MSLNETPSAERLQIGFFGRVNSGKSSLVNAVTNQSLSIVSDKPGTTADPVQKSMELLPLGAVTVIDTAGYDDKTELGMLREEKTFKILSKIDIAVLVTDAASGLTDKDKEIIKLFEEKNIKYITAYNKCDLIKTLPALKNNEIYTSALKNININELKEKIASFKSGLPEKKRLLEGLINKNDIVILVTPIDESAPAGRIILPQQQVLRNILDYNAVSITVKETQLENALKICPCPKLVITDSQVFDYVSSILPENTALTSFSILFARYKGVLKPAVSGAGKIETLKNGDNILISEGCTHHRQCADIGTVKLPRLLKKYTQKRLNFEFAQGGSFPDDLTKYALVIHCGGCMLNDKEVLNRYALCGKQNTPVTNYGIAISYMHGILNRSISMFNEL